MDHQFILKKFYDITRELRKTATLEEILDYLCRECRDLFSADSCSFMLLDSSDRLFSKAADGLTEEEISTIQFEKGIGIAGTVAQENRSICIGNTEDDERFLSFNSQRRKIASILCTPIEIEDNVIGVISLTSEKIHSFSYEDAEILEVFSYLIAKDIENARLFRLSITDPLTGCMNRQSLARTLSVEFARSLRHKHNLSLIILDIDYFKKINDKYGHPCGDLVLREIAATIMQEKRENDFFFRYGGEEFMILMPSTSLGGAWIFAERLRTCFEKNELLYDNKKVQVTASFGLSSLENREALKASELIAEADEQLYLAKNNGRNVVYPKLDIKTQTN